MKAGSLQLLSSSGSQRAEYSPSGRSRTRMNVRDPDHSLLPVVEGAGKQAVSGGYVLRAVIGVKNLASCKGAEGLTNLAGATRMISRRARPTLTGKPAIAQAAPCLRDGLLRAGKKHHEEGGSR